MLPILPASRDDRLAMKLVKTPSSLAPKDRLSAILDSPNPKLAVQSMPVLDFVFTVLALGPADASDLLPLASQRQLRALVDADAWNRDRVDFQRLQVWLDSMDQSGPMGMATAFLSLDPELCGIEMADYRLFDTSPCTETNSPCAWLVGGFNIGCDSPVEETSWGRVKALYRGE